MIPAGAQDILEDEAAAPAPPTDTFDDAESAAPRPSPEDPVVEVSPTADEVRDSPLSLLAAIDAGLVDAPELWTWTEWMKWRDGAGRRPRTTQRISAPEARLRRQTMSSIYGEDWETQVRDYAASAVAPRGPASPAASPAAAAATAPVAATRTREPVRTQRLGQALPGHPTAARDAGQPRLAPAWEDADYVDSEDSSSASAGSQGSWQQLATTQVQRYLSEPYRPDTETLSAFERRMVRA